MGLSARRSARAHKPLDLDCGFAKFPGVDGQEESQKAGGRDRTKRGGTYQAGRNVVFAEWSVVPMLPPLLLFSSSEKALYFSPCHPMRRSSEWRAPGHQGVSVYGHATAQAGRFFTGNQPMPSRLYQYEQ